MQAVRQARILEAAVGDSALSALVAQITSLRHAVASLEEGRSTSQDDLLLNPPFWNWFQERPGHIARTPLRRVYDPPPTRAMKPELLKVVGQLFQRFAIEKIQVPGLPVAMNRLRAIFERFEPGELGRLIDAVTGLEALFLSEGSTDELKFRLQLRLARFLETDLERRVALVKEFSKIYTLRSTMIHMIRRRAEPPPPLAR